MKYISSSTNKLYKIFISLIGSKGIKEQNLCLVSGEKIIAEILKTNTKNVKYLLFNERNHDDISLKYNRFINDIKTVILSNNLFNKLDIYGTKNILAIVEPPSMEQWNGEILSGTNLIIPFQNPSNIGAVIRSAAAFDIDQIVLLKEAASPFLPKSIRAAGSAIFYINLMAGPSILDLVQNKNIIILDSAGEELSKVSFPKNTMLLAGLEGQGIPDTFGKHRHISIKINPVVESLNATVAVSIAAYKIKNNF